MSSINIDIINRIVTLRNEFQNNLENENRILLGIRNILYNIDEMDIDDIRIHLLYYYNNYHNNLLFNNNINFITSTNYNINSVNDYLNFRYNSFERNLFRYDNSSEIISDIESLSDTDSESDFGIYDNQLPSEFISRNVNNYSNSYNNLFTNSMNPSIDHFFNMLNYSESEEQNDMENVPLVITYNELNKIKVCKYKELTSEIKQNNKKCMINLTDFEPDDIVRTLPCEHVFSKDAIDTWLTNNSYKCPICRASAGDHYARVN